MAEETPHATGRDHRVREANYNDRQVYEIPGVFRIATEIVFAKDEVVEHVALGDTVSCEVAPAANSLFIKPRERAVRTNLTVITRSRSEEHTSELLSLMRISSANFCLK